MVWDPNVGKKLFELRRKIPGILRTGDVSDDGHVAVAGFNEPGMLVSWDHHRVRPRRRETRDREL
jgi:hypothetical protein